jgi:hypothetical protein
MVKDCYSYTKIVQNPLQAICNYLFTATFHKWMLSFMRYPRKLDAAVHMYTKFILTLNIGKP